MTQHRNRDAGQTLPAGLLDAIQEFIGTMATPFQLVKASGTSIALKDAAGNDPGTSNSQVSIGIQGDLRFVRAAVNAAVPGGLSVSTHDIFVTSAANDDTAEDAGLFDYSFGLVLLASGSTPGTAIYRKIGTFDWDGSKITGINQLIGFTGASNGAREHVAGDIKGSILTADHGKWRLCDARTNILRSTCSQDYVDAALAAGWTGADGTKIGVPDYVGRALYMLGTHADVNAFTDNDGLIASSRRAKHTHTVASHAHTVAAHSHTVASHTHTVAAHSHSVNAHTHNVPTSNGLIAGDICLLDPSYFGGFYAEPTTTVDRIINALLPSGAISRGGSAVDLYTIQSTSAAPGTSSTALTTNGAAPATDAQSPVTDAQAPATDAQGGAYGVWNVFIYTG